MKTDSQLQRDVSTELEWEPSVHAARIGVEVKDGIVTLAGHVNSYAEKVDAERATMRVSGVKALAVEMDVRLAGSSTRTDAEIARSVDNVLQWTTYLPKDAVKIEQLLLVAVQKLCKEHAFHASANRKLQVHQAIHEQEF